MRKFYSQVSYLLFVGLAGAGIGQVGVGGAGISYADAGRAIPGIDVYRESHSIWYRDSPSIESGRHKVKDSTMATWVDVSTTVGDGIIMVNWKVIKERNTVRYEIQRTEDTTTRYWVVGKVRALRRKSAANIDTLAAAGKNSDSLNYTFTDFSVSPNIVYYYRLLQICKNNLSCFSSMVSATASDPTNKINIYPNPANTFVYVANIGGKGILRIYDQSGRSVLEAPLDGDQQQVNVSSLRTGNYYARIDREGKVQYQQLLMINSNY
jgi:Secretion system C-terminal sorting domain